MEARNHFYQRYVLCLILAGVALIGCPLLLPPLAGTTFLGGLLWGLGFGIAYLLGAYANYAYYKSDLDRETEKDRRLKELQEENRRLKENKEENPR